MNADNWKLNRVDNSEYEPDDTGIYVLINWDIQTDTVRLDFMGRKNEPIQSFAGSSDNVRKHAMRYIHKIGRVNWPNSGYDISLEHAAYIGSELQKADIFRVDYVQDSDEVTSDNVSLLCCGSPIKLEELPGNYNHNFIGRCGKCQIGFGIEKVSDVDVLDDSELSDEEMFSDVVCSKCGYSKSGYSSDNILMCLDCGEAWPTSDNVELTDVQLKAKQTSDNKAAAKTTEEKYS